jgi:hypothetical protein
MMFKLHAMICSLDFLFSPLPAVIIFPDLTSLLIPKYLSPDGRYQHQDVFPLDFINRKIYKLKVKCHIAPSLCHVIGEIGSGTRHMEAIIATANSEIILIMTHF